MSVSLNVACRSAVARLVRGVGLRPRSPLRLRLARMRSPVLALLFICLPNVGFCPAGVPRLRGPSTAVSRTGPAETLAQGRRASFGPLGTIAAAYRGERAAARRASGSGLAVSSGRRRGGRTQGGGVGCLEGGRFEGVRATCRPETGISRLRLVLRAVYRGGASTCRRRAGQGGRGRRRRLGS